MHDAEDGDQLFFKLCSDHLSVEAIPRSRLRIDFVKMKRSLESEYQVLMWTPYFVVLKSVAGNVEITLRKDGRMIIRKTVSEERARLEGRRLLDLLIAKS
jgi:hypothetical protein